MIFVYTGKTGAGKTYTMMKDIYPQWRNGRDIYSNTLLMFENFGGTAGVNIKDTPKVFTLEEKFKELIKKAYCWIKKEKYIPSRRGNIVYFEDITEVIEVKNGIILFDEAQNLFDSRNWESLPDDFSNKLRQHRKHSLDLYATTQNMGTIDINYRRLVQVWKHTEDIFALLWKRNPSWLTIHRVKYKDIDMLYNSVDDLLVDDLRVRYFMIHKLKRKLYDTMYDIGFTALKSIWIQENNKSKLLMIPKKWTLANARTQQLLFKYYLDQNKSMTSKKN